MKRTVPFLGPKIVLFVLILVSCLFLSGCHGELAAGEVSPSPTLLAPSPTPSPTPVPGFSDLSEDSPYYEAVTTLATANVWEGTGDSFRPDALATWADADVAVARLRAYVFPDASGQSDGQSVSDPASQPSQEKLSSLPITRGELAGLLYRSVPLGDTPLYIDLSYFLDSDQVADDQQEAVSWAVANGCFVDLTDAGFYPDLPVTRGQLAQVLSRAMPLQGKADLTAAPSPLLTADQQNTIQAAVERAAQNYGAAGGIQTAVIRHGKLAGAYATGWATRGQVAILDKATGKQYLIESGDPMTPNHKVRAASLSKVIIGMVAMKLAEDGVVDLDGSIGAYWGCAAQNPYYPDTPVSIRSILSHTSSIYIAGDDVVRTYQPVYNRLARGEGFSRVKPGEMSGWGYNNYAFGVLGMTLELAADQTMDDLLDQYFFNTLGIDAAFESGNLKDKQLLTTLYGHGGGVERSLQFQYNDVGKNTPGATASYFAGGLTVSAVDLAKLMAILAGDGVFQGVRLMDAASVEAMELRREPTVGDGFYQCHPLRCQENIYGRAQLYYHTGSAYGVYHLMSYDPETGDGVVVLTTGASGMKDQFGIYAVCGQIAQAVYDSLG